jgi:hypothetical protein
MFQQQIHAQRIEPTLWEQIADYGWLLYYWETERYDRRVCSSWLHGLAQPMNTLERELTGNFARYTQRRIRLLVTELAGSLHLDRDVTQQEWYSAKSAMRGYSHEEVERQLAIHPMGGHAANLRQR